MRFIALFAFVVATACGHPAGNNTDGGNTNCDGGPCIDAPVNSVTYCTPGGTECAAGEVCLGGQCVTDECATESPCGDGTTCRMSCVPTQDPCTGVTCPSGQTCVDGSCYSGCFPPSPCIGVECAAGEYCAHGACLPLSACDAACGPGYQCSFACDGPNPCNGVTCASNEYCIQGTCITNPCAGITCPDTQVCNGGTCVTTCDCPGGCGANGQCILDTCECTPDCTGKACGDDDGCGNECLVPCPEGDPYECKAGTGGHYSCKCVGSCTGKDCGEDDGCGKACATGNCDIGETCVKQGSMYTCVCNPTCPSTPGEDCGAPNACNTGYCQVNDCADSGEVCGAGPGGTYSCSCPASNPTCSGDCCPSASDTCRTDTQTGTGTTGEVPGADACCTTAQACTDPARADVCCTGPDLSCVDSNSDGLTESCCTAARQCNDTSGAETNQGCCAGNEICMDTTVDADVQREQCCPGPQACTETGQCCPSGSYCATRPGGGNDICCTDGTINCDGACVPRCGGDTPNRCNDGVSGNEVCCASGEVFINGACCAPTCPDPTSAACATKDSCGYRECGGTCAPGSVCVAEGNQFNCETVTCTPACNTAACYDCVGGTCDYRCDNPGYAGTFCSGGQCVNIIQ